MGRAVEDAAAVTADSAVGPAGSAVEMVAVAVAVGVSAGVEVAMAGLVVD